MTQELQHIIQGCRNGNARSQEALYKYCYPDMFRICLRYAFGDKDHAGAIYNQAMLKVFHAIGQFKGEGEFLGWIRRIMVNTCIDHGRSQARFRETSMEVQTDYVLPVVPEIYQKISGDEIMRMVHGLPKNTGLVFNLFVLEGYKHEEIGKLLNISPGTSKWHLNEARRLMKEKIAVHFKNENLANAI